MTLLQQHEEAMHFSFLAKQEREIGNEDKALEFYSKAASIESNLADYYLDKEGNEPTKSIIIRSAAFLNLKAGIIEKAEKFIFWGIINSNDEVIKNQLYNGLELCMAFRTLDVREVSGNIDYIYKLRQKSVYYTIEPQSSEYSTAVTLEMISDFSINYTKSLKAYSKSKFKDQFASKYKDAESEESAAQSFEEIINPVLTSAGFGSFKFAVAADFLAKVGETEEVTQLKSNILIRYHSEVFTQVLTDETIQKIKEDFSEDEIDHIFRPLFNIRSVKAEYKVSYYDRDNFQRLSLGRTKQSERSKLLPIKKMDIQDIGKLENTIVHKRSNQKGELSRSVILKQELKSYSFDHPTNIIHPRDLPPIILTQEIIINIGFNSEFGFVFNFEELPIQSSSVMFNEGLINFYTELYYLIKNLNSKMESRNDIENQYWSVIHKFINNPERIV